MSIITRQQLHSTKTIKILIAHNTDPKKHDLFTQQVKNVIENLSLKIKLQIIWCIFPADNTFYDPIQYIGFIDSRRYATAKEIIKHIDPDIIIINGSMDFHNVMMSFTAKHTGIPLVVFFLRNFEAVRVKSNMIAVRSRLRILFKYASESTQEFRYVGSKEIRKFYLHQISWMFKNLRVLNFGFVSSLTFLIKYLAQIFFREFPLDNIICGDLNFCTNELWRRRLIDKKFDKSTIFALGDPYFDGLYSEISKHSEIQSKVNQKIRILFCTTPLHEHGLCSKKEEYDMIKNTIKQINENSDYEISLKIHPSTSSRKDYEENILNELPQKIEFFQKENLINLIRMHDIMLTYGGSGAIHYGVLSGTPVVNLDYKTNATKLNVFVDDNVIIQCKNPELLLKDIERALQRKSSKEKIDDYVEKYIGKFDGNSAKRIANTIDEFLR